MGGGGGAVCVLLSDGDAPSSPELTVGANEDAVYWYAPPPPGIVLRGGTNVRSPLVKRYLQRCGGIEYRLPRRALPAVRDFCALPRNDPSREAEQWMDWSRLRILFSGDGVGDNTLGERGRF